MAASVDSSTSSLDDDETWQEPDWNEQDEQTCISLFSSAAFQSVEACCAHDADNHGFDLRQYIKQARALLQFYALLAVVPCICQHGKALCFEGKRVGTS